MAEQQTATLVPFQIALGPIRREIQLLPLMSLKLARMHVYDQLGKLLKGNDLSEALKAMGFK